MDNLETKPAHVRLGAEVKTLAGHQRRLEALGAALRKVSKVAGAGGNATLAAAEELAVARKSIAGLEDSAGALVAQAKAALKEIEDMGRKSAQKEAMRLLSDLNENLVAGGGTALSGHYPEVHSGALTLLFDLSAKGMSVTLYYGPRLDKLAVVAGADAGKLFEALMAEQKKLDEAVEPAADFLPQLVEAWQVAGALRTTRAPSDAMPILEVLSMLAYRRQSGNFHRNPTKAAFSTFGQTAFSYQLHMLTERRTGDLELVLGIATREDVKKKASLWVPRNARGDGNHFSTLGFRKVL
jgi:hypothetical protein